MAFRATSLISQTRVLLGSPTDEALRAFISTPIFDGNANITSKFFRISNGLVEGSKKIGNSILLSVKSHPYLVVIVGIVVVSGMMWYICREEDSSLESFRMQESQEQQTEEFQSRGECILRTELLKQGNHPLRGGSVTVVYPSITSDPNTQKRVLGVCCICLDRAADTLTLPCKHRVMCSMCFTQKTIAVCPVDRQPIKDCLKIV